jgi:hypothetical protein
MWTALYDDDTKLEQFNEDNSENLFSSIDEDRLIRFIVRAENGLEVIVNTKTGEIKVNGVKLDFGYGDFEHRLIYFRRVRQTLGGSTGPTMTEYVGWQSTIQGSSGPLNIKRIIGIEEDKLTIQCE